MRYKIYYSDGTVYDSEAGGKPGGRGVQVIVQDHPRMGKQVVAGGDFYIRRDDGKWLAVDRWGLMDYLLDTGLVLFGRMVTSEEYRDIFRTAKLEQEKSGWTPVERKPSQ